MDITTILSKTDDRSFNYFSKEFLESLFTTDPNKKNKLLWVLLGLLAVVGTEPFKVVMRKNIGSLSFSFHRLVAAVILYFLWALLLGIMVSHNALDETKLPTVWKSDFALWLAVIFAVAFGIVVLLLGIAEIGRLNKNSNKNQLGIAANVYRGDSRFLSSYLHRGWTPQQIWSRLEPGTCLVIALILTSFNLFLGLPLLGTSLSFWVNEHFQVKNVLGCLDHKTNEAQKQIALQQANKKGKSIFQPVRTKS